MIRKVLKAAVAEGLTFQVSCDGEVDYRRGASVREAMDAINAVDESLVTVYQERAGKWHRIGSAIVIPDLGDDEMIADAGGWVNDWLDENVDY